jgi:hypothetical protein
MNTDPSTYLALVQRNPTECGVSGNRVLSWILGSEEALSHWGCYDMVKKKKNLSLHIVCSVDTSKGQGKLDLVEAVKAYGGAKA